MPSKKETRAMGHIMRKKINKHKDVTYYGRRPDCHKLEKRGF